MLHSYGQSDHFLYLDRIPMNPTRGSQIELVDQGISQFLGEHCNTKNQPSFHCQ